MKSEDILNKIRAESSISLEIRKATVPFEKMLSEIPEIRKRKSFIDALKSGGENGPAIIAELKKASPSAGLIREKFIVEELCSELESGGASALSVVTEENFFMGLLENLKRASYQTQIPLLRKDFIFDAYQICEAKINGASAVLLIARMLSEKEFRELADFAKSLSLDVLSEAHNLDEIEMLSCNGADIIGVNCRDLKNFSTDFSVVEKLMGKIPEGIVKVAESAIGDRETYLRAYNAGADAVLIGTSLMRETKPSIKLKEILGVI